MNPQYYLIPFSNIPQQVQITLAGVDYVLTVKWNDIGQSWILDIQDVNENDLVKGLPLVTGTDLLDGLQYLGIGGALWVLDNSGNIPALVPDLNTLGNSENLYFYTSNPNE